MLALLMDFKSDYVGILADSSQHI